MLERRARFQNSKRNGNQRNKTHKALGGGGGKKPIKKNVDEKKSK
jgi:hypothetical protein